MEKSISIGIDVSDGRDLTGVSFIVQGHRGGRSVGVALADGDEVVLIIKSDGSVSAKVLSDQCELYAADR